MSDSPSNNGRTDTFTDHFIRAISNNDTKTFQQWLKKHMRNLFSLLVDRRGWTILHFTASLDEYNDALEWFLECRDGGLLIDIDAVTFKGETALYIACKNKCEKNVEMLLRNGCDPYKKTSDGSSALLEAVCSKNLKIVEYLLEYPNNINELDPRGCTPLYTAVVGNRFKICRMLLEKGADVLLGDKNQSLPLHFAYKSYRFDIASLLLDRDPTTINWPNYAGTTPFMYAVETCDMTDLHFFMANGAKIDTCDDFGRMPLHFAAWSGNIQIMQVCLQSIAASRIEECLSIIPSVLNAGRELFSLTCSAIQSHKVECLAIVLTSKLAKSILEAPRVVMNDSSYVIYSPLAYLFAKISDDEILNSFLQLLLKHKITMLDEFFKKFQIKWPQGKLRFIHPLSNIIDWKYPYYNGEHHLNLLISNGVNMDYCLQCYHDNSQPFDTFTDYQHYYEPLRNVFTLKKVEILKLMMSTSVILEPDVVSTQFNPIPGFVANSRSTMLQSLEEYREIFQYLISLKPVYFTQFRLRCRDDQTDLPRFPYSTIEEEFSQSTLQQLCRTVIRHHLREHTLIDNLLNFKRKIMELPLPSLLKNYLLFKD